MAAGDHARVAQTRAAAKRLDRGLISGRSLSTDGPCNFEAFAGAGASRPRRRRRRRRACPSAGRRVLSTGRQRPARETFVARGPVSMGRARFMVPLPQPARNRGSPPPPQGASAKAGCRRLYGRPGPLAKIPETAGPIGYPVPAHERLPNQSRMPARPGRGPADSGRGPAAHPGDRGGRRCRLDARARGRDRDRDHGGNRSRK